MFFDNRIGRKGKMLKKEEKLWHTDFVVVLAAAAAVAAVVAAGMVVFLLAVLAYACS